VKDIFYPPFKGRGKTIQSPMQKRQKGMIPKENFKFCNV
jgi:hypothetical protein